MLTSEKKIHKLFIKFISWNKINKCSKLLATYPAISATLPWQKAFEETFRNKQYNACIWIMQQKALYDFEIDVYFNNNELTSTLEKDNYYKNYIQKIILLV